MRFSRTLNVVGVHAAGEVGDVVVGGVLDVPGKTMYEKMLYFWAKHDNIRNLLLNEPRGRAAMNTNIILPPCHPEAEAGFLIMESDEYVPMSGSNAICVATVLLETGMVPMVEPISHIKLDTAAGLITVAADCSNGKCTAVSFDNVPAFVIALDFEVDVPEIGKIKCDIAYGGMMFCVVDAASVGMEITSANGAELVHVGEKIKRAIMAATVPVHPENESIRGISNLIWAGPLDQDEAASADSGVKSVNAAVVLPGRLDRSPCGTGTSARVAILHARGLLKENQPFRHISPIGTEFIAHVRGTTKVGQYDAVLPTVKGTAWISSFKQVVLDPSDPFPEGFRVGDAWHASSGGDRNPQRLGSNQ